MTNKFSSNNHIVIFILAMLVVITLGFIISSHFLHTPIDQQSALNQERSSNQKITTLTDITGRKVQVKVPANRILLGEGRQLYLLAGLLGNDTVNHIAGWRNDLIEADPATYQQYLKVFPELADIPTFKGKEDSLIDLESTIAEKPDVVLLNLEAKSNTEDAQYIEKLDELGIPLLYVDFRHKPLENTNSTIELLGKLVQQEKRASEMISFRKAATEKVTKVLVEHNPKKPKVFIERIGGYSEECCLSFGNENFGNYVELAGGHNIGGEFIPGTFGQLSPEQVIVSDPDHVIVTSANWEAYVPNGRWIPLGPGTDQKEAKKKLEWYPSRTAYTGITAQDDKQFHAIWHQFYNSPYEFVAIQKFAKWLHPELFKDLDPDATFKAFHEQFLPIDYQPGYFISLYEEK